MIDITATIQTNDLTFFEKHLKRLESSAIKSLDIDIVNRDFLPDETVQLADILEYSTDILRFNDIGFHLMTRGYTQEIDMLKELGTFNNKNLRIYVQQEVAAGDYTDFVFEQNWIKGICIQLESKLNDIHYYKNFDEVQFMGVKIGFSGQEFQPKVLVKIDELRNLGYKGRISIDGGVNLHTASLIRRHQVDRVTVNSYFVKATDMRVAYEQLYKALN